MKNDLKKYDYEASMLFRSCHSGILSTISKVRGDYPFGSFVTYVSASNRTVYLYLSDIAEHTKNLNHKSKSCITIFKMNSEGDKQNSKRLTLMGDLKLVSDGDIKDCRNRFYTLLPDSKSYSDMHNFRFYQLEIISARWIGGFGKISWLENKNWNNKKPQWYNRASDIINHMNEDHSNSICSSLNAQYNVKDINAKISIINIDGYYIVSDNISYFIRFPQVCNTLKDYKNTLVGLAKTYHSFEI